jgi:hypothetical protein
VTVVPRTLVDLLRRVDGVPHVVLGPVLLVLAPLLGPARGVPVAALPGSSSPSSRTAHSSSCSRATGA